MLQGAAILVRSEVGHAYLLAKNGFAIEVVHQMRSGAAKESIFCI